MAKLALFFLIATATLIREAIPAPREKERNVLTVTGTLRCGATATNAKQTGLALISKHTFSSDEKVVGAVQEGGKFEVTLVSTTKSLKPELVVYTGCSKGSSICRRKLRFAVPEGAVNNQVYSIGDVDLQRIQIGEDRECSSDNVVTVTGTLKCDGQVATPKDTYLALLNVRDVLPDEKLVATVQEGGKFEVTMITNSKSVHPEVHVYTECNKGNNKCKRKLKFAVPTDYVNLGSTYDIGEINMERPMVNEGRERECY
jgi:hypothetical protein